MTDPVYRTTEITATSTSDISDAVRKGVRRATQTLRNVDWFEVVEIRGRTTENDVEQFQVTMKVGFRLED